MFRKGVVGIFLLFSLLSTSYLLAEGNVTKGESAKKVVKAQKKEDKALEAAKVLLDEMNLKQVYINAVNGLTQRLINANAKFKKVDKKIKAFYQKYIGWKSMKDDLAKLYAKYYTAEELNDITKFYSTKTGKKVLKTMGKLTYEGQMLTQKKLQPHLKELQDILDEAMKEDTKKENKKSDSKK